MNKEACILSTMVHSRMQKHKPEAHLLLYQKNESLPKACLAINNVSRDLTGIVMLS